MDREDFIQSSVRIRYAEKKLLTKQQLQRLADAKVLKMLLSYLMKLLIQVKFLSWIDLKTMKKFYPMF